MNACKHTNTSLIRVIRCLTLAVFCVGVAATAHAGQYYKWTDEKGVTHFTDKPPKNSQAEKVDKTKRIPKTHEQAAAEKQAAVEAAAMAEQKLKCDDEKSRLNKLKTSEKINIRQADGSLRQLTKEEVQEEIAKSENALKVACEGIK